MYADGCGSGWRSHADRGRAIDLQRWHEAWLYRRLLHLEDIIQHNSDLNALEICPPKRELCLSCGGRGGSNYHPRDGTGGPYWRPCEDCKETGAVPISHARPERPRGICLPIADPAVD